MSAVPRFEMSAVEPVAFVGYATGHDVDDVESQVTVDGGGGEEGRRAEKKTSSIFRTTILPVLVIRFIRVGRQQVAGTLLPSVALSLIALSSSFCFDDRKLRLKATESC